MVARQLSLLEQCRHFCKSTLFRELPRRLALPVHECSVGAGLQEIAHDFDSVCRHRRVQRSGPVLVEYNEADYKAPKLDKGVRYDKAVREDGTRLKDDAASSTAGTGTPTQTTPSTTTGTGTETPAQTTPAQTTTGGTSTPTTTTTN